MDPIKIKNALKIAVLFGITIEPMVHLSIQHFRKRTTKKQLMNQVLAVSALNVYLADMLEKNGIEPDEFDEIAITEICSKYWENA